ncbi:MAG: putative Ig domain-containing protein [Acidimicrobiales bacterium]
MRLTSKSGELEGTPATNGSFSFEVEVKDSSRPAAVATRTFTLVIATAP